MARVRRDILRKPSNGNLSYSIMYYKGYYKIKGIYRNLENRKNTELVKTGVAVYRIDYTQRTEK